MFIVRILTKKYHSYFSDLPPPTNAIIRAKRFIEDAWHRIQQNIVNIDNLYKTKLDVMRLKSIFTKYKIKVFNYKIFI